MEGTCQGRHKVGRMGRLTLGRVSTWAEKYRVHVNWTPGGTEGAKKPASATVASDRSAVRRSGRFDCLHERVPRALCQVSVLYG